MDSANLNIDVLHLILSGCDQNTVSQIMKTCRLLNREVVGGADIQSVSRVLKPFFVLVAPQAPNFSLLSINYAEIFFAADPELPASIALLVTLHSLTLDGAGTISVMVLRSLRSSLTKVKVDIDPEISPFAEEDRNPISFLHHSEDTLRCISLACTISSPAARCYRNVRMLSHQEVDVPTTRHLVYALPNLEFLRATECTASYAVDVNDVVQRQRDLNIAEQSRDGSWRRLMSFKGSPLLLYGLGLRCQVLHVSVQDDDEEGIVPRQIEAILRDTTPSHLTIRIREVVYLLSQADDFLQLSGSEELRRLPSLRLHFHLWQRSWNADIEGIFDLIYDVIAPLPVPAVTLIVDISSALIKPVYTSGFRPGGSPRIDEHSPPSPVKVYLDALNPDTVAELLFTGNPSRCAVKVVFIRTWKGEEVTAHRGDPQLIIDHDFDKFF